MLNLLSSAVFAQANYYYYKGEKRPLEVRNDKVILLIPHGYKGDYSVDNTYVEQVIMDSYYQILKESSTSMTDGEDDVFSRAEDSFENNEYVCVTPCYVSQDGSDIVATNYLNVRLKKCDDITLLASLAEEYHLEIVRQDVFLPLWYVLSITPQTGLTSVEVANLLFETGHFQCSVADFTSAGLDADNKSSVLPFCPNDESVSSQWAIYRTDDYSFDINLFPAWEYSTGRGVTIGIVDTGVDVTHGDLSDNVMGEGFDCETGISHSLVYDEHGTHCAGIAAAVTNNHLMIAGVAPEAKLVSISKLMSGSSTNNALKLADGISWAWQNGIDVLSCSWHMNVENEAIDEAIENALQYGRQGKGCVIVFAAGNQMTGQVSYPARIDERIITVGAITRLGAKASFSNYGVGLDVVAPGHEILSTLPLNNLGYKDGTSMACPHVSGLAALMLGKNPSLTNQDVARIISLTTRKDGLMNASFTEHEEYGTWDLRYGYGLIDAEMAVLAVPEDEGGLTSKTERNSLQQESVRFCFSKQSDIVISSPTIIKSIAVKSSQGFTMWHVLCNSNRVVCPLGESLSPSQIYIFMVRTEAGTSVFKYKK